jgi:L-ribulose-5-phosphate 3-epimerase
MPAVKPLQVGLFFWAEPDPRETLRLVKSTGVTSGQLGVDGTVRIDAALADAWKKALAEESFHLLTVFAAYEGESYADIPTVVRTVGFMPRAVRAARETRSREVIDFAAALGVRSFACHAGYVPHDPLHSDYRDVRDVVRRICDYAASYGMNFCLETGQEPAPVLLRFFEDVDRPNLRINFDPANMVLYGSGEPSEAFRLLARHVESAHAKDGDWPHPGVEGALGRERALGQGSVNLPKFIKTIKECGYTGSLNIESGVHGEQQRWLFLKSAVEYLQSLI